LKTAVDEVKQERFFAVVIERRIRAAAFEALPNSKVRFRAKSETAIRQPARTLFRRSSR
jgi:hypothetical protein